jgi:hypothetical protein
MRRQCCLLQIKSGPYVLHLAELLVLRVVLRGVTRHTTLRHTCILVGGLLCLEVLLVMQRGFRSHVCCRHARVLRHSTRLSSRHLRVAILGRVDLVAVHAIGIVARRLGRVQTGLRRVSSCCERTLWRCTYLNKVLALGLRNKRL